MNKDNTRIYEINIDFILVNYGDDADMKGCDISVYNINAYKKWHSEFHETMQKANSKFFRSERYQNSYFAIRRALDGDRSILNRYACQGYTNFNTLAAIFALQCDQIAVRECIEKYGASDINQIYTMAISSGCCNDFLDYLISKGATNNT